MIYLEVAGRHGADTDGSEINLTVDENHFTIRSIDMSHTPEPIQNFIEQQIKNNIDMEKIIKRRSEEISLGFEYKGCDFNEGHFIGKLDVQLYYNEECFNKQ